MFKFVIPGVKARLPDREAAIREMELILIHMGEVQRCSSRLFGRLLLILSYRGSVYAT